MTDMTLKQLYRPTAAEASRQRFVGLLKNYANGALEAQLAEHYQRVLLPRFEAAHGRAPAGRDEARPLFEAEPLYQLWGSMVYASQALMWQTVGETCERVRPGYEARATQLGQAPRGSLTLDPSLPIPKPIADVEIHRQPGGYFAERSPQDLMAGLIYFGTIELYRAAKGLSANAPIGEPGIGRYIASVIRKRYPGLKPQRILDPVADDMAFMHRHLPVNDQVEFDERGAPGDPRLEVMHFQRAGRISRDNITNAHGVR